MSFLSLNRTVLLISDEALYIYSAGSKGVECVDSIDWGSENFESQVVDIIVKKCGRKPVLILNDMVEQHYRKEKIIKPPGFGDKAAMIKRKLNIAFPSYPVRAAFPLKEKIKKSAGQLAADIYIFAAVPNSTQFNQTMAVASKSLASVAGFCLLPVESSTMLKALSVKLSKDKKAKPAKWCVFLGQHKNGGLRQIVTKDGEIALTRMTPVCSLDDGSEKWAAEVHQEFKSTMSYLARFGYTPDDSIDVIVLAETNAGSLLSTMVADTGVQFHTMTVHEVAQLLGIRIGRQEEGVHYADPLHVAWSAKKSAFILPMKASKVDEVSKPRQVAMVASIFMFLSASFLGYQALSSGQKLAAINNDILSATKQKAQLDLRYQKELAKKEEMGFDVRLVQSSIKVYGEFEENNIEAIDFFEGIGRSLGRDLRVDRVILEPYKKDIVSRFNNFVPQAGQASKPLYKTVLQMTYPSTADVVRGNNEVQSLSDRLGEILTNYEVKVTKLLKDYEYTEGLVVETGDLERNDLTQDFLAEITIEGPLKGGKAQ